MENARSYFGRLSGLALFLIALLVVGLLVIFTIQSADEDNGVVTTDDTATTSETSGQDEPVAVPDLDSEPAVTGNRAGDTADEGTVAGDQSGLPNTGPEEAILPAFVIGLLAWQIISYRDSRRQLMAADNR